MKIDLVLTLTPVSFPEWRTGRSLPCQSVQLADSCDCHDEFPVHPCRPLSRNDWRNQGKPTTQVRNLQQTVWPASMWWSSFKSYWTLRFVFKWAVLCLFSAETTCQRRPERCWAPSCLPLDCGCSSSTSWDTLSRLSSPTMDGSLNPMEKWARQLNCGW